MSNETPIENWFVVKQQISSLLEQLQAHRDYEEEVSYDTDFVDMLNDAIEPLLALMPTSIAQDTVNRVKTVVLFR